MAMGESLARIRGATSGIGDPPAAERNPRGRDSYAAVCKIRFSQRFASLPEKLSDRAREQGLTSEFVAKITALSRCVSGL